jgi:DNA-binding beta-propeller fold protein YncE
VTRCRQERRKPGSDTVTPIKVATNRPGPEIKVGSEPDALAITLNGKTVYVADWAPTR